ncbi:TonB-dependent receptor [Bacteroides sp. 224]|uniref:SusC/RagA family TonB-linked outer membrane protein n=1 Tax=Bacteroides sp. 224 TaxID=2302936 RepID=UPI0013CFC33F|nr:TonB-dependent receptor [Bacteroides sp. 224]NDV66585.1 TonB-dependent receptor [Bacteroides sp. 224]
MRKQLYILFMMLLACTTGAFAQEGVITLTGTVTDDSKETLIGVSVAVKDKVGTGTITDLDGNFSIKVTPYSTLIFSYVGYEKQEINIGTKTTLNVVLKSENVLDEVIVTGAGAQRKLTSTGAITTVNIKDLKGVASTNLSNSLAGNVAGIIARQSSGQPGQNASEFWIRGISTFGAGSSALVLVDGFERDFNEINIEDIETFSVLKDASATAIYGSKGANGVILITTKRGEAGKININTKAEYSYNTRTRTPDFVDGITYAGMVNEALVSRNREPLYTAEEIDLIRYQMDPDLYPNVDWMDMLLRDGAPTYKVSVNVDGGGSTARYYASASYLNEGGMYKTDKALKDYKTNANMDRWNYRMNFDMDVTPTTLVSAGISGFLETTNEPGLAGDIWHSVIGQNPISIPVLYSDGKIPAYGTGNRTNPWVLATQTGFVQNWKSVSQVNANIKQDLKFITDGLRFEARIGLDNTSKNKVGRIKWPEQYKAKRRRDLNGDLVVDRVSTESFLHQQASSQSERFINIEAEFHYNKLFNQKHRVGAMVKYMQSEKTEPAYERKWRTEEKDGKTYFYWDETDMQFLIRGMPKRNMGLSGRTTYAFMDKYMVEFNFGYTGSENFKKGHQFGFFPAVSAGWNIAQEKFIQKALPWLTMAKVRYSYGEVGNDNIGTRFPYLVEVGNRDGYNFGDINQAYGIGGLHMSKVAADYLTWEVAKKHNIGFDLNILNNKFSATIDIFKDTREDIYMERKNLSGMTGITSKPWANVGKMESKGFDGNFAFTENIGEVTLTLRGNITYTKNEVIEHDEETNALPYRMIQGYRWRQVKGLVAEGLFEDYEDIRNSPKQTFGAYMPGDIKYKDINGDGVIDDKDIVAIGATEVPNLIYGLGLSVLWKGFDFNVHFQGAGKSSKMIEGSSVYPFINSDWGNIFKEVANSSDRWISKEISGDPATENPNAKYPRLSYGGQGNNYRASTFWLRDGKYVRLKTLEIGYTLPSNFLNKFRISRARVYFIGNNLALWDSLKLWDPELDTTNGQKYPLSKSFTLGLTLGF